VHISMLEPVETELLIHSLRTNVLETLEALKPPPVVGRPTFKYVHLLCPHPPFVFARDGLLPPMSTLFAGVIGDQERHNGYVNQVEFISRSVLERLKVILETDKSDPIIILQGDHGYIHRPLDHDLVKRRWSADLLQAQYGILYAVRVPKRLPMPFYNGVSPENGFRIVINSLLNLQMPMLPDRYFYSVNVEPFNFIDVTDELLRSNALEATPLPLPRS